MRTKAEREEARRQDEERAAARRAERAKEEAAEKVHRKAQRDQQLADTEVQARLLSNLNGTDFTNMVLWSIGTEWLRVNSELKESVEKFMYEPAHWFEWCESEMKLAARRDLLDKILWQLRQSQNEGGLLRILISLRNDISERVMKNYDRPCSTSWSSNAMAINMLDVRCSFLSELNRWIEKLSEAALAGA